MSQPEILHSGTFSTRGSMLRGAQLRIWMTGDKTKNFQQGFLALLGCVIICSLAKVAGIRPNSPQMQRRTCGHYYEHGYTRVKLESFDPRGHQFNLGSQLALQG